MMRKFMSYTNSINKNPQPIYTGANSVPSKPSKQPRIMRELHRELELQEANEAAQYDGLYYIPKTIFIYRGEANNGYDNNEGRYKTRESDHIAYRYEIKCKLGMGAFGDCYKCFDHKTQQVVAVKIIRNERRFTRQGEIEIGILEKLSEGAHANRSVKMIDHFTFRNHLCITFELHNQCLYTELSSRKFKGMSDIEVAFAIQDIAKCLSQLKQHRIVHADLKPENILVSGLNATGEVTVIDFGSSCYESEAVNTYIQSRYYRAPEIVIGCPKQGCPIDMWSLGCILFELMNGRPLFHAKCERDLLLYHQELLGVIPGSILANAKRTGEFFIIQGQSYSPKRLVDRRLRTVIPGTRDLASILPNGDPDLLDFMQRCLKYDPEERLTPDEALRHPFVTKNIRLHSDTLTTSKSTHSSRESFDSGLGPNLDSPPKKAEVCLG